MNRFAIPVLFCVAFFGFLLAGLSAINVYRANDLYFCFQPGCFEFAYRKYMEAVQIVISTGVVVAYLAALGGSYLAMKTYLDSVSRDADNRHLTNFKLFKSGVVGFDVPGFDLSTLNVNAFYYFIFPRSKEGRCTVSADYLSFISSVIEKVQLSNSTYGSGTAWDKSEHCRFMIALFGKIGLEIEEPSDDLILMLEPRVFAFLDLVSSRVLDVPTLIGTPYRSYAA